MKRCTSLILAVHGCRQDHRVNERLARLAECVAREGPFADVRVAYHLGEPAFSTVLDEHPAREAIVVPLMTSAGYFNAVVLPRELARNARFPDVQVRIARPVGEHPEMAALVENRVRYLLEGNGLNGVDAALAIVGHGTPRHAESCRATIDLAARLESLGLCTEVAVGFLDQSPSVETILARTSKPVVLVIPFMISDGPHTVRDIPERLGISIPDDVALPFRGRADGRTVLLDRAVGEDPAIVSLITSLAEGVS